MNRRSAVLGLLFGMFGSIGRPSPALSAQTTDYDIVVIGSGAAGLAAAVSAAEQGAARILVLEKNSSIGGHTILSTGYVSGVIKKNVPPELYRLQIESMIEGMKNTAGSRGEEALARKLVEESGDVFLWMESMGLTWLSNVFQTLGGLAPRSYISSTVRAGYDYVTTLNKAARKAGVHLCFSTRALSLIQNSDGSIGGVECLRNGKIQRIKASAVILATGGYGGNVGMRKKYVPILDASFPTTADPNFTGNDAATGDGILMGEAVGAALTDMDCIQVIPFWGGRLTDYVGADVYLDDHGDRFVNEGLPWKKIADAILKLPDRSFWVVTDSQSLQGASRSTKIMNGIVRTANSIEEMAQGMNINPTKLRNTLERYNGFVRDGYDVDFGKNMFTQEISKPPFYYGRERLYVHYCCGGLRINTDASVLDHSGQPIAGLYAAGEVTGGVHGEDRLGGTSITDCLVFGRQAGKSAAIYIAGKLS